MADKKVSELDAITGADTAADDLFLIVDSSGSVTKKISRAELNNAIEQDVLATVDINGGTIDGTAIGGTTPSTGDFTTLTTTGNATIGGDLTINGTTTTVNSTTLDIDDINITVASGAANAAAADGAGLTVDGASATFNYASTGDKWTMNKPLDVTGDIIVSGNVDGRDVAADGTKLDGIEAGADVTDATSVQTAGALMDSELTNEAAVKALDQSVATTDGPSFVDATFTGTGAVKMPAGTTAQRPTAAQGQIRFNTTDTTFEGYDGSAWGAIGGDSGETSLILYEYTATSGQTTFSGADDNAATLSYTADNIQVVMNGIVLDPSDYTATNGTSVVLATGAAANDIVNIYAFKSFTVADTVSASAGGTFSANVAITGDLTVDTNTLYVDSANNRVGVGSAAPSAPLTVQADSSTLSLRLLGRSADDRSDLEFYENDGTTKIAAISTETDNIGIIASGASSTLSMTANTSRFRNTSGTELMRIDSDGRMLIGDTTNVGTADHKLSIQKGTGGRCLGLGTTLTSASIKISFVNGNGTVGTVQTSGTSTSYNTSSDHRLKENVADMTGAIDRVKALAPKRFNFIADADTTVDGFLAHEAQAVVPEAVTGTHNEVDDDGNAVMQGIDQSKLVPLLTGALQEAIAKIEALEARIEALENAS